jgi:hypothetical protein
LTDDSCHAFDILMQRFGNSSIGQGVDAAAQDRQWRAQFMRRIGGELPLHAESGLESIQRLIDRLHEGQDLFGNFFGRQAYVGSVRIDFFRHFRSVEQRPQRPAEDHDVDRQQE